MTNGCGPASLSFLLLAGLAPVFIGLAGSSAAGVSPSSIPEPDFVLHVDAVQDGRMLSYTIHFDNVGAGTAASVILADDLPDGATYLGDAGDLVNGVWTKTYSNLVPGPYAETVAVALPDATKNEDRVVNVVELRYVGFSGLWATRAYEHEFGVSLPVPKTAEAQVPTPAWVVAAPLAAGAAIVGGFVVARPRRRPKLEQVFLMHNSGMLIHHWAANVSPSRDIDILSGMFVILREFVRDSFREKSGGLTELQFGDSRVFLAEGRHAILAAVVSGNRVNGLPGQIRAAVEDFERVHGANLAAWTGQLELLPGAKGTVDRLVRGEYGHRRIAG